MKIKRITVSALLTAFIIICSLISVPNFIGGVSVTLQIFAVAFCGYLLGVKLGIRVVLIYVMLGTVGLPVFSGFKGGIGVLLGATGGFIIGFFALVLLCGLAKRVKNFFGLILTSFAGVILCHILGIIHYSLYSGCGFVKSVILVSLPFLPKDLFLVTGAYFFAKTIEKSLKKSNMEI